MFKAFLMTLSFLFCFKAFGFISPVDFKNTHENRVLVLKDIYNNYKTNKLNRQREIISFSRLVNIPDKKLLSKIIKEHNNLIYKSYELLFFIYIEESFNKYNLFSEAELKNIEG